MKKIKIILFFILFFMHSICINIVHPITTTYVNSLSLPDYYFGFFFALMSLGQVIGALIFGSLSDKIGRKWLIIIGIIGYSLSQLGFGFLNTHPLLILLFRVIAGIFVSAPNTLFISMCLDISSKEQKVKMLSILSCFSILGASLGYEIGGSLYNYLNFSISDIFISQFIICVVTSFLLSISIKDVNKKEYSSFNKKVTFYSFKALNKITIILLISLLVLTIGQILISKYLDTYIIHIGYQPSTLGHYVLITGIVGSLSNLIILPLIKKIKVNHYKYFLLSFVLLQAILTLITFSSEENIMLFLFTTHMIYCIFKSLITPLEQNELSNFSSSEDYGKLMGSRQTILSLGNVFGPLIGSLIYTQGNAQVFIVSAFIILLSFVLYSTYFLIQKKSIQKNK